MARWRKRPCRIDEAHALLAEVSREHNVDVRTLRDKGKHALAPRYVVIRREFCTRGKAMKITMVELAIALNRDHTTISYHASPEIQKRKKAQRIAWGQRKRGEQHAEVS